MPRPQGPLPWAVLLCVLPRVHSQLCLQAGVWLLSGAGPQQAEHTGSEGPWLPCPEQSECHQEASPPQTQLNPLWLSAGP